MTTHGLSTDRMGLEVLPRFECWNLLASTPVGRVAFIHGGEPVILPVTHGVSGRTIIFRTGMGSKLLAAHSGQIVAFEADEWEAFSRTGWSVLARGLAETVHNAEAVAAFEAERVEPWLASAAEGVWIRIRVEEISGRRIPAPDHRGHRHDW